MRSEHSNPKLEAFIDEHASEKEAELQERLQDAQEKKEVEDARSLSELEQLREQMKSKELSLREAIARIEEAEDALVIHESKILGKLANFFEVRKLKEQIGIEAESKEDLERQYHEAVELVMEMEAQVQDRSDITALESALQEFYADQEAALAEYERIQEIRDVSNVLREHQAIIAHSFTATDKSAAVTVMQKGVTWKERLNTLIGLQPEVPVSTVRDSNPKDELYYRMGAILKGGSIELAESSDAATHVQGKKRTKRTSNADIETAIDRSINKDTNFYNELIVSQPEVAGIYVDEQIFSKAPMGQFEGAGIYGETPREVREHINDFLEHAKDQGLPAYIRGEDGKFYELQDPPFVTKAIEPGVTIEVFNLGKEVDSQDILESDFAISEEQKQGAREAIFENAPFKLNMPERRAFDWLKNAPELFQKCKTTESMAPEPEKHSITHDSYANVFDAVKQGKYKNTTSLLEDLRWLSTEGKQREEQKLDQLQKKIARKEENNQHVHPHDHFLVDYKQKNLIQIRLNAGIFAHKFAEVAKHNGDSKTAEQFSEFANTVMNSDEYTSYIDRRVGKDGGFKMTEEDLQYIST